jgi:hypothetical protein
MIMAASTIAELSIRFWIMTSPRKPGLGWVRPRSMAVGNGDGFTDDRMRRATL